MRWALFAAVQLALLVASPNVRADDAADRLKLAQQVVVVAHVADNLRTVMPVMMAQLRPLVTQGGNVDSATLDEFTKRFNARANAAADLFAEKMAQMYATQFSAQDLENLLSFYKTPTGQNLLSKQTVVAQASMVIGKQLGQDLAKQVVEDMDKEKQAKPSKM